MTITREINGKTYTFELTGSEMREAYVEQQREYDVEDVESIIYDTYDAEDFKDFFGITQEQAARWNGRIADRKRTYQDEGQDWIAAAREAIWYYVEDIKQEVTA